MHADPFSADRGEPLALRAGPGPAPSGFDDAHCLHLEFSSRGDRVPGNLLLPQGTGPHPVLILEHGLGGSRHSEYLQSAARWLREGTAVATIDLPLHGDRHSPKMSERLRGSFDDALAGRPIDENARRLWTEFGRQSVLDLRRLIDALDGLGGPAGAGGGVQLDTGRIAYAGFSLGGILGALFCAVDPRPRAAALALAGGGFGPEAIDPVRWIGGLAPRPVLFVNTTADERIPRAATEALFEAAAEPKQIEWFDGTHQTLPGAALKSMWSFLRPHLGLD